MPWPVSSRSSGFASLTAATATGAGKAVSVAGSRDISLQVTVTGGSPTVVVALEGTVDGSTWFVIATWSTGGGNASGDIVFVADKPVAQVRANLTTLSGGTAPTVTATIGSGGR